MPQPSVKLARRPVSLVAAICALMALALGLSAAPSHAQDATKLADIRRLIEVTGGGRALDSVSFDMVRGMTPNIRASFPDTRDDVFGLLLKEVQRQYLDNKVAFVDVLVPIYDRRFTHDEVRDMLAFWESPVGRKLAGLQLQLLKESAASVRDWARNVAPDMIDQAVAAMRSRGHTL